MSEESGAHLRYQYKAFLDALPTDWETKSISQLGAVFGGGTPSRDVPSFWRGTIPWVTPGEVSEEASKYLHDTADHISPAGLAGSGANLLPSGSLMVTTRATLGARAINAVPMATNQGFKSIAFRHVQDADYYFHLFEKVKPELVRRGSGTTFLEVSGAEFGTILVPSPPRGEKQQIAHVLDTLDIAIQQTEAIIAKLKALKQGLLHDLLTRGIDANGELRAPHSEAPHLYKASQLGFIPREWTLKTGYDVCEEIVVGIVIRPTQYYRSEGIPVLRSANVRENRLSMADLVFMSERDHRSLRKSAVRPGDVLTVRTGYPGTSCVVDSSVREANCVDILISRPSDRLDADFWSLWINSHLGKSQVLAAQGGLAQQHFNVGDLQKLFVSLPGRTEQTEIAQRLAAAELRTDAESKALATLTDLKRGLMDDLLTGSVRVTPLLTKTEQPNLKAVA